MSTISSSLRGLSAATRTQSTAFGGRCRDPHGQRETSLSRRPTGKGSFLTIGGLCIPHGLLGRGRTCISRFRRPVPCPLGHEEKTEVGAGTVTGVPWPCRALDESPRRPGFQSGVDRMRGMTAPTSCPRQESDLRASDLENHRLGSARTRAWSRGPESDRRTFRLQRKPLPLGYLDTERMMRIELTWDTLATCCLTSRLHPRISQSENQSGRRESDTHDTGWKPVALPIGHTRETKEQERMMGIGPT